MPSFVILWLTLDLLLVAAGAFMASCFAPACVRGGRAAEIAPPPPGDPSRPPVLDYARRAGPRFARYYGLVLCMFQFAPLLLSLALASYLAAVHGRAELPLAFVVVGFILTALAAAAAACIVRWFRHRVRAGELPRLGQFRRRAGILASMLLVLFPVAAWGMHRWVCWRMDGQYERVLARLELTEEQRWNDREELLAIALPQAKELHADGGGLFGGSDAAEQDGAETRPDAAKGLDKQTALATAIAEIQRNHGRAVIVLPSMRPDPRNTANLSGSEPIFFLGTAAEDLPFLLLERTRELAHDNLPEALRCLQAWTWLVDDLARGIDLQAVGCSLRSRAVAVSTLQTLLPLVSDERQLSALTAPRSLLEGEALTQIIDADSAEVAQRAKYQASGVSWIGWLKSLSPGYNSRNWMRDIGRPAPEMIFHTAFVLPGESLLDQSYRRLQSDRAKRGELWQALPANDPSRKSRPNSTLLGSDFPGIIDLIINSESQRVVWQSAVEATRFRLRHGHLPADAAELAEAGLPVQPPAAVSKRLRITIQPSSQALRIASEGPSADFAPSVITLQPSSSSSR